MLSPAVSQRMVWVDLEMTGLDIEKDQIIEMACIVTDSDLNILAEGPNLIINQPNKLLEGMSYWCKEQHGKILRHVNLDFHCYADDTRIYLSTNTPHNPPLSHINSCLSSIKSCMQQDSLKLNRDKTQLLLIGSKTTLSKTNSLTLDIDGTSIPPSFQAHNFTVIFDSTLSLEPQIRHLRNIPKIRPSLDPLQQRNSSTPSSPPLLTIATHSSMASATPR
ncbi:uncharacterized protein AB9W97_008806 isoform 3-T4 [Spinachia spinachia]